MQNFKQYRICSLYKSIYDDFEHNKTMLSRKGYPTYILDKCIREFFNRNLTATITFKKKYSTSKKIFIRLPFLGDLLLQIRNELKCFLRKHTDDKA